MRLTQVIDDGDSSAAGYKFDLFNAETETVVKAFATREAVLEAVTVGGGERSFDVVLVDAANAKFQRRELEDDGLILIKQADVATAG